MNKQQVKAAIVAYVKANANNEITGDGLQSILLQMIGIIPEEGSESINRFKIRYGKLEIMTDSDSFSVPISEIKDELGIIDDNSTDSEKSTFSAKKITEKLESIPELTGSQIKQMYEEQPDTNVFDDDAKNKLSGLDKTKYEKIANKTDTVEDEENPSTKKFLSVKGVVDWVKSKISNLVSWSDKVTSMDDYDNLDDEHFPTAKAVKTMSGENQKTVEIGSIGLNPSKKLPVGSVFLGVINSFYLNNPSQEDLNKSLYGVFINPNANSFKRSCLIVIGGQPDRRGHSQFELQNDGGLFFKQNNTQTTSTGGGPANRIGPPVPLYYVEDFDVEHFDKSGSIISKRFHEEYFLSELQAIAFKNYAQEFQNKLIL